MNAKLISFPSNVKDTFVNVVLFDSHRQCSMGEGFRLELGFSGLNSISTFSKLSDLTLTPLISLGKGRQ